ncbi:SsrA-binding protein SmpB [Pinisolibacter aquiterrae]|uniref:SsrA-binding protein SmpB n=1 Tax=Pinisolibacter aquiterrae TaxID=2815579 RepID=UPI001C3CFBD3|nr:SsrA-binding protein SmpB [Pinisolibacter aquiterrae]MBV5264174.1 SsrA-binding protein SmpB [Pinisolibacter aquiterrae]MCC8233732.1 SsrA-binding protein SmpB [Pinisolibacter aquiterrae]
MASAKDGERFKLAAENRKARFSYHIVDTWEAGIALTGTEIKSLRGGRSNITDAYAAPYGSDIFLYNCYIPEYLQANRFNHETRRPRRLLLHRKEINKLVGAVEREGMTLVPLDIHFNEKGRAKITLALAKGKNAADKRETEKEREWNREKSRLMKYKE